MSKEQELLAQIAALPTQNITKQELVAALIKEFGGVVGFAKQVLKRYRSKTTGVSNQVQILRAVLSAGLTLDGPMQSEDLDDDKRAAFTRYIAEQYLAGHDNGHAEGADDGGSVA